MRILIESYGSTSVEVDDAEYFQAVKDGRLDHLLDAYASDMDYETTVEEPSGVIRDYSTGGVQR